MATQLCLQAPDVAPTAGDWNWVIGEETIEWRYQMSGPGCAGLTVDEVLDCIDQEDRSFAKSQMVAMIETGEPSFFATPVRHGDKSVVTEPVIV